MAKLSKRSYQALQGVHPKMIHAICEAIIDTPLDFTIVSGLRTTEEQKALYAQGRTKAGNRVTNADGVKSLSNHQDEADGLKDGYGAAVDFYPYYNGSVQVNAPVAKFEQVARHIQATAKRLGYRIDWGGDWRSFKDNPHLELK